MEKTTIVNEFGAPIYSKPQLVIATMGIDGRIDTSSAQPLHEWNSGVRSHTLIAPAHGSDLLEILAIELGLVDVNDEGMLHSKIFITPDPNVTAMRLLGKIAEAIVVKRCNECVVANRRWAMYARKGKKPHKSLDAFRAIGTGLNSTQRLYPTKYNPTDSQRDILWINKESEKEALLQITENNNSAVAAGLQLKVSQDGFKYIYRSDIERTRYEVPLIYFDLSNDYYKLADAIYREELNFQVGVDIVRGRDVDPECHELLLSYYHLVFALITGKMTIDQLIQDSLLFDSFKKEFHEQSGKKILVI
jgi:hypothetical protein